MPRDCIEIPNKEMHWTLYERLSFLADFNEPLVQYSMSTALVEDSRLAGVVW